MPDFPLEKIEDCYTYYVQIMGLNEDTFWNADIWFLDNCLENKTAYDGWFNGVMQKERERLGRKK